METTSKRRSTRDFPSQPLCTQHLAFTSIPSNISESPRSDYVEFQVPTALPVTFAVQARDNVSNSARKFATQRKGRKSGIPQGNDESTETNVSSPRKRSSSASVPQVPPAQDTRRVRGRTEGGSEQSLIATASRNKSKSPSRSKGRSPSPTKPVSFSSPSPPSMPSDSDEEMEDRIVPATSGNEFIASSPKQGFRRHASPTSPPDLTTMRLTSKPPTPPPRIPPMFPVPNLTITDSQPLPEEIVAALEAHRNSRSMVTRSQTRNQMSYLQTIFSPSYHVSKSSGSRQGSVERDSPRRMTDHSSSQSSTKSSARSSAVEKIEAESQVESDENLAPKPHHHHHAHMEKDEVEEDLPESEDEQLEDNDEFDPFWFIRNLPPYEPTGAPVALPRKTRSSPSITLVLDLDETLVHCSTSPLTDPDLQFPIDFNDQRFEVSGRLRPYWRHFLQEVSKQFEVIVFTASQRIYADTLLDLLDPNKEFIKHRLFREHCLYLGGNYLKDLNILGRDLKRTVIVDNSPQAFGYQINNGIPITSWYEDKKDRELLDVLNFLNTIVDADDVRPHIENRFQLRARIQQAANAVPQ